MAKYNITVNRAKHEVEAEPNVPLLWVLRDYLGLKGTKFGCGIAACGACTVHLDGRPVRSCQMQVGAISPNSKITTIEGISERGLHPVQQAWIALQVPQCGYCQSGQIMTTVALLAQNPKPTDEDIDNALTGNLCRCGTYDRIRKAVHLAAENIKH